MYDRVITIKLDYSKVPSKSKGPFPLRAWKKAFFVCFIDFFALASIFTARFNRRSIKERKNALFHARSGNEP